jgi:thiol-disulfide isomerase/thioredoxin
LHAAQPTDTFDVTSLRTVLLALLLVVGLAPAAAAAEGDAEVELIVFWGIGCPYCAQELEFLDDLGEDYPELEITSYEVRYEPANLDLFNSTMSERGLEARSIPTTLLGDRVWEGFDAGTGDQIRAAVAAALTGPAPAPIPEPEPSAVIDLPFIGAVDVGSGSLVLSTFLIALVDGVNPCSLWALSILLALVLRTGSRRRVLAIGGAFLAVTTLLYGLYIAGIYGFLTIAANETWIRLAMAGVALGFGVINLKDYFWFRRGPTLTIPDERKPWLYRRMRSVAASDRALPAALAGTAVLAVGVSVLETPCTAGYPLLWTNLLAEQGIGLAGSIPLFALYMLVFLLDELVVFGVALFAMRAMKLEERTGRLLKLIGGVVMIVLAGTLVFTPEAMSSVSGAIAVFGIAIGAVLAIVGAQWAMSRRRHTKNRRRSLGRVRG